MHSKNKPQIPFVPQHLVAAELPDPIVSAYWASGLTFSPGDACLEEGKERSRLDKKKQVLFSSAVNETRVT